MVTDVVGVVTPETAEVVRSDGENGTLLAV
jgi:hypothetical protein